MLDRFERFSLAIFEISRHWHKLAAEETAPYGLKSSHAIYLTALARFPEGVTGPQLVELCGRDKSDVSRAIAILQDKGLATKEGAYGGRFQLTGRGREVADQIGQRAALAVELAGGQLSDETRETFYQALERIAAQLREISKEGLPK